MHLDGRGSNLARPIGARCSGRLIDFLGVLVAMPPAAR
jgi:hypothetical protein